MNFRHSVLRSLLGCALMLPLATQSAEFSIVVIPDTQMYAERHPEVFEAQIDWIVANEVAENIIYVAHLGDIKDDGLCDSKIINVGTGGGRSEWEIVDQAIGDLDAANIPYGLAVGNHEFDQFAGGCPNYTTQRPLSNYNFWFGPNRYLGDAHYGDPSVPTPGNRVVNSNEDNFTLFESGGAKFIAINLAYKQAANQAGNDAEITWADNLLSTYSDRIGIVTSHYFVDDNTPKNLGGPKNVLSGYGQEVYDALSGNQNLFLMMSAHRFGEAWRVENTGRQVAWPPTQILLADYQAVAFPAGPDPELADFGNLNGSMTFGDSGLMRIMRFDTITGMVDVETFIPPVVPIKARPDTIVSNYFPASGADMDRNTASNFSFSFLGYAPIASGPEELVSCGIDTEAGDLISRGFYHPSYPGSTLDEVELRISASIAGGYRIRLDAMLGSYGGPIIASDTNTQIMDANSNTTTSWTFDMGNAAVAPGSIVTFRLTQETGPAAQLFYAVDSARHVFGGPGANCDMIQTNGTNPTLDSLRRDGLWIRINGEP